MTGDAVNPQDAVLLEQGTPPASDTPAANITQYPITVYALGSKFEVKDLNAWQFIPVGLFATGTWEYAPVDERDIILPFTSIGHIEVHFPEGFNGGDDE